MTISTQGEEKGFKRVSGFPWRSRVWLSEYRKDVIPFIHGNH